PWVVVLKNIGTKSSVVQDQNNAACTFSPLLTNYPTASSVTQPGALTPATFNPADADTADVALQVVAITPPVTPVGVADSYSMAPNTASFATTLAVNGALGVLKNDTDAGRSMNAVLTGSGVTPGTGTVGGTATTT